MQGRISHSIIEAARRLDSSRDAELITDLARIAEIADLHLETVYWHPRTEDIIDEIECAESKKHLSSSAVGLCRAFSLRHVTIAAVREAPGCVFQCRMLTTAPREWMERYIDERDQMRDPLFADPQPGTQARLDELAKSSPVAADFLRRAAEERIGHSGLVSWEEVSTGTVVAVMFTSDLTATRFRTWLDRMHVDLSAMAAALARAFTRLNGPADINPMALSDEELQLFRIVAGGASGQPHTITTAEKTRALCARLGTTTLSQAAIAVSSSGILSYTPLLMSELWFCSAEEAHDNSAPHIEYFDQERGSDCARAANIEQLLPSEIPGEQNVFAVGRQSRGWSVFRDGRRTSRIFESEMAAERACTQAAWGSRPEMPQSTGEADQIFSSGLHDVNHGTSMNNMAALKTDAQFSVKLPLSRSMAQPDPLKVARVRVAELLKEISRLDEFLLEQSPPTPARILRR